MKTYYQWIVVAVSLFCCTALYAKKICEVPHVIKKIENYDIIATNTGTISTAFAFSGDHLQYRVSAHPKNKKNKVMIDSKTGVIHIKAEKKDLFDVSVKAKNSCGSATTKFNVQIDEEE